MAETIGSLVDKICILELKIYHTQEQVDRKDVGEDHIRMCQERIGILKRQRDDLAVELNDTIDAWTAGRWTPRVYRQFKMYNDPRFRIPARAS